MTKQISARDFIGTWLLVSCEHRLRDKTIVYPFGKAAKGLLIYTKDGHMSGTLMANGRRKFVSRELFGGTAEEKVNAAETYLHYAGRFEVSGTQVLHVVEFSLFPNWVGSIQKRFHRFFEDKLELRVGPFIAGGIKQTAHLVWVRSR